MDEKLLANELRYTFPNLTVLEQEPMCSHCSFRIGGPADVFVEPDDGMELEALRRFLWEKGEEPVIIGNGTNLLVKDEGVRGVVVHIGPGVDAVRREGNMIYAEAGVTLAHLAVFAKEQGLSGLEFAHGIPGSLGGAVMMNAGAYGGEMKDVVTAVRFLNEQGRSGETEELDFAYRRSRFEGGKDIILGAALKLHPDAPEAIHGRMMELWAKRSGSQPLDKPSAGSTFKRPANGYAAALIEQAGLKGFRIGGAMVSEKHAGFVINTGGAACADVLALMEHIQNTVYERFGTKLSPEVRLIG